MGHNYWKTGVYHTPRFDEPTIDAKKVLHCFLFTYNKCRNDGHEWNFHETKCHFTRRKTLFISIPLGTTEISFQFRTISIYSRAFYPVWRKSMMMNIDISTEMTRRYNAITSGILGVPTIHWHYEVLVWKLFWTSPEDSRFRIVGLPPQSNYGVNAEFKATN